MRVCTAHILKGAHVDRVSNAVTTNGKMMNDHTAGPTRKERRVCVLTSQCVPPSIPICDYIHTYTYMWVCVCVSSYACRSLHHECWTGRLCGAPATTALVSPVSLCLSAGGLARRGVQSTYSSVFCLLLCLPLSISLSLSLSLLLVLSLRVCVCLSLSLSVCV